MVKTGPPAADVTTNKKNRRSKFFRCSNVRTTSRHSNITKGDLVPHERSAAQSDRTFFRGPTTEPLGEVVLALKNATATAPHKREGGEKSPRLQRGALCPLSLLNFGEAAAASTSSGGLDSGWKGQLLFGPLGGKGEGGRSLTLHAAPFDFGVALLLSKRIRS